MNEATRQAMLQDIIRLTTLPAQEDDEFTIAEFVKAGGAENTSTGRRRLNCLVEKGVLTRRLVRGRNGEPRVWAFSIVPQDGDSGSRPNQE